MTRDIVERIVAGRQSVIVVGAGRSGCDLVLELLRAGTPAHQLTWLVRRPKHFLKLERCWHRCGTEGETDPGRALLAMARACIAALAVGLSFAFPRLGWRLMRALDYTFSPQDRRTDDAAHSLEGGCDARGHSARSSEGWPPIWSARAWEGESAFRMGMLDEAQRRSLSQKVKQHFGAPAAYDGDALVLQSGVRLEAQAIIWATGYETGVASLSLQRDGGEAFRMPSTAILFEHLLPTCFPVLALPAHFFIAPGPEAAREAAEYLLYHLCVRQPLSDATMAAEASVQACKQTVGRALPFADGFWHNMALVQVDLINAGILPLWVALQRLAAFWIWNRVPPLELGLLPAARQGENPRDGATRCPLLRGFLQRFWTGGKPAVALPSMSTPDARAATSKHTVAAVVPGAELPVADANGLAHLPEAAEPSSRSCYSSGADAENKPLLV